MRYYRTIIFEKEGSKKRRKRTDKPFHFTTFENYPGYVVAKRFFPKIILDTEIKDVKPTFVVVYWSKFVMIPVVLASVLAWGWIKLPDDYKDPAKLEIIIENAERKAHGLPPIPIESGFGYSEPRELEKSFREAGQKSPDTPAREAKQPQEPPKPRNYSAEGPPEQRTTQPHKQSTSPLDQICQGFDRERLNDLYKKASLVGYKHTSRVDKVDYSLKIFFPLNVTNPDHSGEHIAAYASELWRVCGSDVEKLEIRISTSADKGTPKGNADVSMARLKHTKDKLALSLRVPGGPFPGKITLDKNYKESPDRDPMWRYVKLTVTGRQPYAISN